MASTDTTTIQIQNAPPIASIQGDATGVPGQTREFNLSAADPSSADQAAGFTYEWSVTKNGLPYASGTGATGSYLPDEISDYVITATASDQNGGISPPAGVAVQITAVALQGQDLAVGGTSGDDVIEISFSVDPGHPVQVVLNGSTLWNSPVVGQILVFGADGNDELRVNGTEIDDLAIKTVGQILWQSPFTQTIRWADIEHTTIDLRAGDDYILDPGANTTILGGPGNDTITVDSTLEGGVLVDGGDGADTTIVAFGALEGTVQISDSGSTADESNQLVIQTTVVNNSFSVTSTQVTWGTESAEVIQYAPTIAVVLETGTGENDVAVLSSADAGVTIVPQGTVDRLTVQLGELAGSVAVTTETQSANVSSTFSARTRTTR